jgi:fructose-specific phosphotransferase system IIC component
MSDYWALRIFTKFGTVIAVASTIFIPVAVAGSMAFSVWSWAMFAAAVVTGLIAGFLIKVFSELARLIVDMLLPMPN